MPKGLQGFQKGHPCYFHPSIEKTIEIKTRMRQNNPMKNSSIREKHKKIMQIVAKDPIRNQKISQKLTKKIKVNCITCGNILFLPPCRINKKANFCSTVCQCKWQSHHFKGIKNPFYGKHHIKGRFSGSNHPNWKGGITPLRKKLYFSEEYKNWRNSVFVKHNYLCARCDTKGYLIAHHIKSWTKYPESRFDINNGIALCIPCHKITHNNNFREDLKKEAIIQRQDRPKGGNGGSTPSCLIGGKNK